jgi:hypothetical protein
MNSFCVRFIFIALLAFYSSISNGDAKQPRWQDLAIELEGDLKTRFDAIQGLRKLNDLDEKLR